MKCPNDETVLVMSDRQGIEIDYCPQCRGVWLDRGELDKIIERSSVQQAQASSQPDPDKRNHEQYDEKPRYDERDKDSYQQPYKKRKKESFLGELFDF